MQLLISNTLDPHINLATEEYLLKNSADDIIFLYRNRPSIVVGKHQNAMAEVNYRFVHENNIPVVRRISGGGTVYHDEGNINFSFLRNGEEGNLVNFKSFITPVAGFLEQYGIAADIGARNDILINGLKVSGNAEHIFRKRTLHHGTLLFSSALSHLREALHVEPGKYTDRAVKSVRSKVTNISGSMEGMDVLQFFEALIGYLGEFYNAQTLTLNKEALQEIEGAATSKYTDWNWNYAYSPDYTFRNLFISAGVHLEICLFVEKGIIQKAEIIGNAIKEVIEDIEIKLRAKPHSFETVLSIENQLKYIAPTNTSELLWAFF